MSKQETWLKPRHKVITFLARPVLSTWSRLKYGVTVEPFREQGDRQYLVLINHQTAFDQFFIGMAFRGPVYYLASEDLFSKGWISALLRWAVNPIPIKKQTTDVRAVRNCLKVIKEGGTLALAPEGNRTYSGKTEYMNPAIVKMAKKFKLPIALMRIEGGYGVHPRWSDVVRKGKMRAFISQVIEPEDAVAMTEEQLGEVIRQGLYVDEGCEGGPFEHPQLAEYMERAFYVCPQCGLTTFESHGDQITCKSCGLTARYLPTRRLEGVDKPFPFQFTTQWYDYQCSFVNKLDTRLHTDTPLYKEHASLSEVIVYKNKVLLREQVQLHLYGDRLVIDEGKENEMVFPFAETDAFTVLGKNKVNIYFGDKLYQLKGDKRFNGLKYVNLFYRHKNIVKGNEHVQFLGL